VRAPGPDRSRRGTKLSFRQFALLGFLAWGLLLAALDWGLGGLRHPRAALVEKVGREGDGPAPVLFPETPRRLAAPAAVRRAGAARPLAAAGAPLSPQVALASLVVPVSGVSRDDLRDSFSEARSGGRRHDAIDILAKRNTPVVAAADGTIDKFFTSAAGGLTIYELEPSGQYELYYAHLESYAPGLSEGDAVQQGQVIGYVGTSGNAPKDVPHLHFAIMRMGPERAWWKGEAINPYPLLAHPPGGAVQAAR
jgi:murein DD-endopeptidase MepM/ murein hydrolase activator NlpD